MRWFSALPLRLRSLFRRDQLERELHDELQFHIDALTESHVARGLSHEDARRAARRETYGLEAVKDSARDTWVPRSVQGLGQDFRLAFRALRRAPGFTAVAVLALALGIGANAAVLTLANAMLYKDLPFADSDRVLYVQGLNRASGRTSGVSYPDFRDFRSQIKSLERLGAMVQDAANISDEIGTPRQYSRLNMSANGFSVLGQVPVAGRDFRPEDEQPGAAPVAMLSYGLWESRYGSDRGIIGKSIRINDRPTVVVGVMPRGLQFPGLTDVWMPLIPTGAYDTRDARDLTLFGKMARGTTIKSVGAEMDTLARGLSAQYPATNKDVSTKVMTFHDFYFGGKFNGLFVALSGAVAFVLLIACANVANLLLARGVGRSREISIRTALGASRWRVIRQLLVESAILATAGGLFGWLVALWGVRLFDAAVASAKPPFIVFSADLKVIAYLALITLGTAVLFGLAPALRLSRLDSNLTLKDGGHGTTGGRRGKNLSAVLVVIEMALAVVLLAGAGLMIRSFMNLSQAPLGVQPDHVLTMRLTLRGSKYQRPDDEVAFHDRLLERLGGLPGVDAVALTSNLPARGLLSFAYELEGAAPVDSGRGPATGALVTNPSYFRVMGVDLRAGRAFTESDGSTGSPVVIVNGSFAATSWPGQTPLGKRLRLITPPAGSPAGTPAPQAWLTVVGVAPDILQSPHPANAPDPIIYLPYRQQPTKGMWVVARTAVPPGNLAEPFRRAVEAVDEDVAANLMSLDDSLALATGTWRILGTMFGVFAGIALLLASVGLYAVIAHSVSQRTQEIGVRIAMGASSGNILRLVFSQGMRQLGIGLAVGLAAATVVTQALNSMLVGVNPSDPITLTSVVVVLSLAGALGCLIPACRAIRVDPVSALRSQ